nr:hypothetical protein CcurKRNrm2_p168 [Cryptomonas curvata]
MIKNILNYVKKSKHCFSEDLRYELGIDLEISDKLKKKTFSFKNLSYKKEERTFKFTCIESLKTKSDLVLLIKNSLQGINISSFFRCYNNIKNDLIDLIKFNGTDRILIILKGKSYFNLMLFYYNNLNYIPITNTDILRWHRK